MNTATQISSTIHSTGGNKAFHALKSLLTYVGIPVTHSPANESLFYSAPPHNTWQRYDEELDFYQSIARTPFHIVYNDGVIDTETALQVAYAMLKNRPVIITGAPLFAPHLDSFLKTVTTRRINRFHAVNLPELELTELSLLLGKLRPIDYSLSKSEKVLIHARIKAHFRVLSEEAKG